MRSMSFPEELAATPSVWFDHPQEMEWSREMRCLQL